MKNISKTIPFLLVAVFLFIGALIAGAAINPVAVEIQPKEAPPVFVLAFDNTPRQLGGKNLAVDKSGKYIYVMNMTNFTVCDSSGKQIGDADNATGKPTNAGYLYDVAINSQNHLILSDVSNNHVLEYKVNPNLPNQMIKLVRKIDGVTNGNVPLKAPTYIAIGPGNRLNVTCDKYIVAEIQHPFYRKIGLGKLSKPTGIAVDSHGDIYVADANASCIYKYSRSGTLLKTIGRPGSGYGSFNAPAAIKIGSGDNLYVCDTGNNRIQKLDKDGNFITAWGATITNGYKAFRRFDHPCGIALYSTIRYVNDAGGVQKFRQVQIPIPQ
ncbi:MAG: NHL repeat-containing protein [Candidatus Margulisbacteria bacterium]|nr:NHL repeat-containing protein [Candidatus Margulisiibacteriota bacterium]